MSTRYVVEGRRMDRSIAAFEHACEIYIEEENAKLDPENALIALLCDAVRVSRELTDISMRGNSQ